MLQLLGAEETKNIVGGRGALCKEAARRAVEIGKAGARAIAEGIIYDEEQL